MAVPLTAPSLAAASEGLATLENSERGRVHRRVAEGGGGGGRRAPGLHCGKAGSGMGGEDDLLGSKMDQAGSICFVGLSSMFSLLPQPTSKAMLA